MRWNYLSILNFNGRTVEFWEWISNSTPHYYLSMLGFKLTDVITKTKQSTTKQAQADTQRTKLVGPTLVNIGSTLLTLGHSRAKPDCCLGVSCSVVSIRFQVTRLLSMLHDECILFRITVIIYLFQQLFAYAFHRVLSHLVWEEAQNPPHGPQNQIVCVWVLITVMAGMTNSNPHR